MQQVKFDLDDFSKSRILVIGDIMLDCYLWGKVERISPEAPVPIVQTLKRTYMLGGAGNVALNLASIGCQSDIMAVCGKDRAGSRLKEMLEHNAIQSRLVEDERHITITKTRIMALEQQLLRIDEERVQTLSTDLRNAFISNCEVIIPDYRVVIISDYGKGLMQTPEVTESIISICRASDIAVLVDPKGRDWERYKNATCITPNSSEFNLITDKNIESEDELIATSAGIIEKYSLEWLLVTRGAKGMCLKGKEKERSLLIPTEARQVYDVSGAGDTVIAVLAAGISIGLSFEDAARVANRAAGVVVGKVGTQPVTKSELERALSDSCI